MSLRDLVFNIFARDRTGRAFDAVQRRMGGLSRQARGAGAAVAGIGASSGLARFGQSILDAAGNFESAMKRVGAASNSITDDEVKALSDEAIKLGATTQFSATEAADAVETLIKNGLSASDVLGGALSSSLTLAAASGAKLSDAGDIATDVMQQFNKKAGEMEGVVNGIACPR